MFENLTNKLETIFKKLRGYGKLNEDNIKEALREIRIALLEADVNLNVVKEFIEKIKIRAVGQEVMSSLTPGQQVVKIVNEELTTMLGGTNSGIALVSKPPIIIMMVGLQGSGKTTTSAKLARRFLKEGQLPLLVAADIYRPAAIEQLNILGKELGIPVFNGNGANNPIDICKRSLAEALEKGCRSIVIDTAGRLHIDEELMQELKNIKGEIKPHEILFVADAMTGQDAVNVAKTFNEHIGIDGIVLTKMDGDARGGAALSIRSVTGKPIKFIGIGEKLDQLEQFYPDRIASRILGMGDVLSLIEKAQDSFNQEAAQKMQKKLREDSFTLEDFRDQLSQIKKLGPIEQIVGMIPGMGKMKVGEENEKELVRIAAIIDSMTRKEKNNHTIINGSRKKRIAKGSGTEVWEVNRLLKQFVQMKKMMRQFSKPGFMKKFGMPNQLMGNGKGMFPF
ncbi:MAG: signal recognition particle protein [Nitrospinae bacterium RIFCSPLOWO2_12_39_16]|nr:MAG: signal recognition particle protein [Nitrospinae bacterium RIFCSPLOWO2_12_39_16]